MLFFRRSADEKPWDASMGLVDSVLSTNLASCFIVGAGPSILGMTSQEQFEVSTSCAGKFSVNYGGFVDGFGWLIKPNYWTSYDRLEQFSSHILLDPTITKFIKDSRHTEPVPDCAAKAVDLPNTYFFKPEARTYDNFVDLTSHAILDCRDSMVFAIDIAIRLGYRRLYLLGADLRVVPSQEQEEHFGVRLEDVVVEGKHTNRLKHWVEEVAAKHNLPIVGVYEQLNKLPREEQYCADVAKTFEKAVSADNHYWHTVQYLRQARKSFSRYGVQLINCTAGSRLEPYFGLTSIADACTEIQKNCGMPLDESSIGRYNPNFTSTRMPYHEDIPPYNMRNALQPPPGVPVGVPVKLTPPRVQNYLAYTQKETHAEDAAHHSNG